MTSRRRVSSCIAPAVWPRSEARSAARGFPPRDVNTPAVEAVECRASAARLRKCRRKRLQDTHRR
eukprot:512806-Prymnesium_polylepis.1